MHASGLNVKFMIFIGKTSCDVKYFYVSTNYTTKAKVSLLILSDFLLHYTLTGQFIRYIYGAQTDAVQSIRPTILNVFIVLV